MKEKTICRLGDVETTYNAESHRKQSSAFDETRLKSDIAFYLEGRTRSGFIGQPCIQEFCGERKLPR
jgi:hypothetical protein